MDTPPTTAQMLALLSGTDLTKADFSGAKLSGPNSRGPTAAPAHESEEH